VHFPKAGGSSLLRQFEAIFGATLLRDYAHPPLSRHEERVAAPLTEGTAAVIGHFHAGKYDNVPNAVRATFLRHPIDNLISIYFFWRGLAPVARIPAHVQFLAESPTLDEFALYPELRTLMSVAYFGNCDMGRFDFIGFHETRKVDVPALGTLIGAPLDPELHENRTVVAAREAEVLRSNERLIRRVRDRLDDDIIFYEKLFALRVLGRAKTFAP
jgi:hypothetical protein